MDISLFQLQFEYCQLERKWFKRKKHYERMVEIERLLNVSVEEDETAENVGGGQELPAAPSNEELWERERKKPGLPVW